MLPVVALVADPGEDTPKAVSLLSNHHTVDPLAAADTLNKAVLSKLGDKQASEGESILT